MLVGVMTANFFKSTWETDALFFYPYSLKSLIFDMTLDFFALYEMSLSGGSGVDERTRIWRKAFVETGGLMLERLFVGIAEV